MQSIKSSLTTPKSFSFLPDFGGFSTLQCSPANRACNHVYQIHQTPPAAFVGFRTVYSQAMDALHLLLCQIHQTPPAAFDGISTPQYRARWIEHVAMCAKSIKLHRLLWLDAGLCTAKPWMLCICNCTNSIKVQQLGYLFTACWWILEGFGMVPCKKA